MPAIHYAGEALGVRQLAASIAKITYNEPNGTAYFRAPRASPLYRNLS